VVTSSVADVAVIGDGLAGLTAALECAARGLTVFVCGASSAGGASQASAGILGPSIGGRPSDHAAQPFMRAARDFYPTFLAQLHALSGISVPTVLGVLQFPESNSALDAAERALPADATLIGGQELADLEPALPRGWVGVFHERDGAVDVGLLRTALASAVSRNRAITRCAEAAGVRRDGRDITSVELRDGSRLTAAHCIVANGAWAGLLPGLPRELPVTPLKGEIVFASPAPLRHVVFGGGGYIVPRGNELLIGATSQETGFDSRVTEAAAKTLSAIADAVLPGSAPWRPRVTRQVAGLRPVTPDLLPIVGADPDDSSIVYASGYSRNGVLLAPLVARCVADVVCGAEVGFDFAAFSPTRFAATDASSG
jgi:glycine oxidase